MKKLAVMFVVIFTCLNPDLLLADYDKQQAPEEYSSRFILNNKGEAFDKRTKLTWQRCSAGVTWKEGVGCIGSPKLMSLEDARQFARQAGEGWRVPTIEELYSIVDQESENPAINSAVFSDIRDLGEGSPYWSVTQVKEMPMLIYFVDFMNGRVDGHSEGFAMAVRLVRN